MVSLQMEGTAGCSREGTAGCSEGGTRIRSLDGTADHSLSLGRKPIIAEVLPSKKNRNAAIARVMNSHFVVPAFLKQRKMAIYVS